MEYVGYQISPCSILLTPLFLHFDKDPLSCEQIYIDFCAILGQNDVGLQSLVVIVCPSSLPPLPPFLSRWTPSLPHLTVPEGQNQPDRTRESSTDSGDKCQPSRIFKYYS